MIASLLQTIRAKRGVPALPVLLVAALSTGLTACSPEARTSGSRGAGGGSQAGVQAQSGQTAEQVFHIATVHLDAETNVRGDEAHPPEPFPAGAPESNGGFIVRPPDKNGDWSVRAFVFQPAQVVVRQGDPVVLNFMGVQGPSHAIAIDGQREQLSLKRGELKTVRFVAEQPGVIRFTSVGREPTMEGSVLVLPRNAGEESSR